MRASRSSAVPRDLVFCAALAFLRVSDFTVNVVLLTAAELVLIRALRNRPGEWVTMGELLEVATSTSSRPETVTRAMLSRIRREFKKAGLANPIEVAYRRGYRLTAEGLAVEVADRSATKLAQWKEASS